MLNIVPGRESAHFEEINISIPLKFLNFKAFPDSLFPLCEQLCKNMVKF